MLFCGENNYISFKNNLSPKEHIIEDPEKSNFSNELQQHNLLHAMSPSLSNMYIGSIMSFGSSFEIDRHCVSEKLYKVPVINQ